MIKAGWYTVKYQGDTLISARQWLSEIGLNPKYWQVSKGWGLPIFSEDTLLPYGERVFVSVRPVFVHFDGLSMPVAEWLKTRVEDISTHIVLHKGRVLQNGEEIYIGWTVKVRPRKIVSKS